MRLISPLGVPTQIDPDWKTIDAVIRHERVDIVDLNGGAQAIK
jgi:hypothetical protein